MGRSRKEGETTACAGAVIADLVRQERFCGGGSARTSSAADISFLRSHGSVFFVTILDTRGKLDGLEFVESRVKGTP